MKKRIYDNEEILTYLKKLKKYHILISLKDDNETNFNTEKNIYFINYQDLKQLSEIKNKPFELKITDQINQNYYFHQQQKILQVHPHLYHKQRTRDYWLDLRDELLGRNKRN
ncbi:MAG: hypothetical protein Q2306_01305 [Phytoplasma sp.]|uniref:hypothetical protein n=1 Tax=Phytoplasma sp. TaxID=2155 RepID=UPI002B40F48E|nr:hypothetical protein [Phytoplasma sp.]WRH06527.1 MAG: hypothetical protein Q2306_01305 [Phytoplasma sp.]